MTTKTPDFNISYLDALRKRKKKGKENLKHSSTAETKDFLDNEPESQKHYPQDQETRVNISVLH